MKRAFDFFLSLFLLVVLSPFFLIISLLILVFSPGPVLFKQTRIGLNMNPFTILKFRTMHVSKEDQTPLTKGSTDPRITPIGAILRKYKLDELPQIVNVLKGEMSFVGPRPEVQKYVALYSEEQKRVFQVRPGITDEASIEFRNENELLEGQQDPEKFYIEEILPKKLNMSLKYVESHNLIFDFKIILRTAKKVLCS